MLHRFVKYQITHSFNVRYILSFFEVHLAKMIWKTTSIIMTMREQESVLRKSILSEKLSNIYDAIVNQLMGLHEPLPNNEVLDEEQYNQLTSCYSQAMTQFKFQLMTLNLDTIQHLLHGYQQIFNELQRKLSVCCNEHLIEAIEKRQQVMKETHELYLEHKLNTFSDHL